MISIIQARLARVLSLYSFAAYVNFEATAWHARGTISFISLENKRDDVRVVARPLTIRLVRANVPSSWLNIGGSRALPTHVVTVATTSSRVASVHTHSTVDPVTMLNATSNIAGEPAWSPAGALAIATC